MSEKPTDDANKLAQALEDLVWSVRAAVPSARLGLPLSVALNVAERELRKHKERHGQKTLG